MIESKMTGAQIVVADCQLQQVKMNDDGTPATDDAGNFVVEQLPGKRISAMDPQAGTAWHLEFTLDACEELAASLRDRPKVDVYRGLNGHLAPGGLPRMRV